MLIKQSFNRLSIVYNRISITFAPSKKVGR